jgi:hypothetical protein
MFSYLVPNWQEWNMILIWLKNVFFLQTKWNSTKLRKKHSTIMPKENAFEISERKMILRLFDVLLFYSFSMRLDIFDLDYLELR